MRLRHFLDCLVQNKPGVLLCLSSILTTCRFHNGSRVGCGVARRVRHRNLRPDLPVYRVQRLGRCRQVLSKEGAAEDLVRLSPCPMRCVSP